MKPLINITLNNYLWIIIIVFFQLSAKAQIDEPVVLGYFPSWSENWTSTGQNSTLREVPEYVNYVFLSFAKPNLTYISGSYDIVETGIQMPYDGCTLKESISALNDKGIGVLLSIGGETYWGTEDAYNIDYVQIKDLVDDMGFVGVDWDYEPNGSFGQIGTPENVAHYIDFITETRALMPASEGYLIACAPSGVGALGGVVNDDIASPFQFTNRNMLTGENDDNLYNGPASTNGINLFGFSATGHMIPVMEAVGNDIDLIAFQGYNVGGSLNRTIMYDAYAHYAEQYGFIIAAGVHFPNEPWGPYFNYSHENVANIAQHIFTHPQRMDEPDGIMIWQLLMENGDSSAYSFLNVGEKVLNGTDVTTALNNANNFMMSPYMGGAVGCNGNPGSDTSYCETQEYLAELSYPTAGTAVFYDCAIWTNQWYANPNEIPGENQVWVFESDCLESENCGVTSSWAYNLDEDLRLYPNPSTGHLLLSKDQGDLNYQIFNIIGEKVSDGRLKSEKMIDVTNLASGVYTILFDDSLILRFIKE